MVLRDLPLTGERRPSPGLPLPLDLLMVVLTSIPVYVVISLAYMWVANVLPYPYTIKGNWSLARYQNDGLNLMCLRVLFEFVCFFSKSQIADLVLQVSQIHCQITVIMDVVTRTFSIGVKLCPPLKMVSKSPTRTRASIKSVINLRHIICSPVATTHYSAGLDQSGQNQGSVGASGSSCSVLVPLLEGRPDRRCHQSRRRIEGGDPSRRHL